MTQDPCIAIVGGGIAGVCLAIALQRRNIEVVVYEQAAQFGEIGAGVSFNSAAVRAMEVCSPDIHAAFHKVATRNQAPEKLTTFFEWMDGQADVPLGEETHLFSMTNEFGANAVHRAHFLDEIVKCLKPGSARFGKRLDTIIDQGDDKPLTLRFLDGSEEPANAVIGCDGIKSRVRAWILGDGSPGSAPSYTHKYAYRGLIPMEQATQVLGESNTKSAKMHLGQDAHVLTFAVNHGKTMNVVAFRTNPAPWPSTERLTLRSNKSQVQKDFAAFGPTVQKIIDMLQPELDCWAIFDLGDHPMSAYNKGRVCVLGDAGHATSPHHGGGAGMCIEDAAIMAELLDDERVRRSGSKGMEAAFGTYSDVRLERTHWLVQSSRRVGDLFEWRAEGVGRDIEKIHRELVERHSTLWNAQISDMIAEARSALDKVVPM